MYPTSTTGVRVRPRGPDMVDNQDVSLRASHLLYSNSPVVATWGFDDSRRFEKQPVNLERRAAFLLGILAACPSSQTALEATLLALEAIIEHWSKGLRSADEAVRLLEQIRPVKELLPEEASMNAEKAALNWITNMRLDSEVFQAIADLAELCPYLFSEPQRTLESWGPEFEEFLESERDWLLQELDDPDWLEQEIRSFSRIGEALGSDTSELEWKAENRIEELRNICEPESVEDLPAVQSRLQDESGIEAEIDELFLSLL